MASHPSPLRIETLRELIAAGSVRSATLLGQRGGFAVLVQIGLQERLLSNRAGVARVYARLDTAAKDLRALGLGEFGVNVVHFEPGRLRPARPDRAAAMKQRATDAAYTEFLRERTQAALDDPRPSLSATEAAARMNAKKAAQLAQLESVFGAQR